MRLDEFIKALLDLSFETQVEPEYAVMVEVNTDLGRTKVFVDRLEYDGAGGIVIVTE